MKRFPKTVTFLCVVIAMFTMLSLKGGQAEAASVQRFSSYRSNAGAPPFKILNAVAEVSARDIWAVGVSFTPSNPVERTLIEHWNGTAWSIVPSPNPTESDEASLSGIAEVAANNIWAVGSSNGALIEHWNGKQWSIVPSGSANISLTAVAAVSTKDIWAVGGTSSSNGVGQLTEHWNGTRWTPVANPIPAGAFDVFLNGVTAVSTRDIWAVGTFSSFSSGTFTELPLIEHWNGKQWSIVPSPLPAETNEMILNGVSEVSAHDVWAVGQRAGQTLVEHWDGKQWKIVPSPNQPLGGTLTAVTEVSARNVWAVGSYGVTIGDFAFPQTLIEHWDGKAWSIVPSPNVTTDDNNALNGVVNVSARNIWAVGIFFTRNGPGLPLIEHWNGVQWSIVPGAN